MNNNHQYTLKLIWTGNKGSGTASYRSYNRNHIIQIQGKPDLLASSDPVFRGDPGRYNPEELLLASLSGCHMLWFLHFCADAGVVVESYEDEAKGILSLESDGKGKFTEVILSPVVTIQNAYPDQILTKLHHKANTMCFIAASVNFPVQHEPIWKIKQ